MSAATRNAWRRAASLAIFASAALASAHAQPAPDKLALCAACHGEKGVPVDKSVPVIAGQQEGYLYLELRDYKLGNRRNELMQQVAAGLEKPDMQALAAYFAAQPWPDLQQPRAPEAPAHRAEILAGSAACEGCHAVGFAGAGVTPRAAGQGSDYLRGTMLAFKSGARGNNPWMSALMKTYGDGDIEALAAYLAGL